MLWFSKLQLNVSFLGAFSADNILAQIDEFVIRLRSSEQAGIWPFTSFENNEDLPSSHFVFS